MKGEGKKEIFPPYTARYRIKGGRGKWVPCYCHHSAGSPCDVDWLHNRLLLKSRLHVASFLDNGMPSIQAKLQKTV